ncbi:MAG: hypothetical protein MHM6MM_002108 [Cercozoa sp. M6MM]
MCAQNGSLSRKLGNAFAERMSLQAQKNDMTLQITEREVGLTPLPYLTQGYTETGLALPSAMPISGELTDELMQADVVLLETPVHNFTTSANIKLWYDLTLTAGNAFEYTETGSRGLLGDKKFVLLQGSGGTAVSSPVNFLAPHFDLLIGKFCGAQIVAKIGISARGGDEEFAQAKKQFDEVIAKILADAE